MSDDTTPIGELKNLGPTSASWLEAVGIETKTDLLSIGTVNVYRMVKQAGFQASLNLRKTLAI